MIKQPELLLHPNIPKPLHGIAPRVIKGKRWWDSVRQDAYFLSDFHCWACGVHKTKAKHRQWLEAHECYEIDYPAGRMVMTEIVALCHYCHNYIHSGRLQMMLARGEITQEFHDAIRLHGDALTEGLIRKPTPKKSAPWSDWRMVIDGKEYGPSTANFEEWERGEWRNWKPTGAEPL